MSIKFTDGDSKAAIPKSPTPSPPPSPILRRTPSPTPSLLAEEFELEDFNDRLASFIERVKNLENAHARLAFELHATCDAAARGSSSIRQMFKTEAAARKLIIKTAHENVFLAKRSKN